MYTINLERSSIRKKQAQIQATLGELKNYPTIALLELTSLPDALFQALRKKIREKGGKVKVLRKAVLMRVLQKAGKLSSYAEKVDRPFALILTSLSPYELNKFFKENRKKRAARTGEKAPFDLIVPEGDTDLPPGPALSELKGAGINVQIKAGKIVVAKDSTIAKSGETITDIKTKVLQKLGILPFESKARLFIAYDGSYLYAPEILDMDETLDGDLSAALTQGYNLSLNAGYPTVHNAPLLLREAIRQAINVSLNASVYSSTTIETLLSSALRQAKPLEELAAQEPPPKGAQAEEKKEDAKKQENKGDEK